ncbi:uncharacterized protein LOC125579806 [Brassica napus]|uniref:uncharacterized protein LOC125579806 n=1 Tax=Brassica napus TaxID=3708 RepID=UPI002078DF6C|nr:uncharacterized protein LOC125579806 [Brassica napus]
MGPPTEQSAELCVADLLIQEGMRWNRRKIQPVLPEYEEQILSLKPSLTGVSDKLIWLSTKSGDYSVKYGYYVAVESDVQIAGADTEFDWSKNVWKLDCAPKVKLFSWKLLKGALPVGERLIERHIEVDPTCKRCGCNESIIHLLFQCQFAQKETLSSAIRLAREWNKDSKSETSGQIRNRRVELPTPNGATIVRSDAAWSGNGNVAGLGWIIIDPTQHKEFQRRMEYIASPLMAEGLALREAVLTCLELGLRNIKMKSDSAQLIKCLNTGEHVAELHNVLSDILLLSSGLVPVSFAWLLREKNVEADTLAKCALNVVEPLLVGETVIAPN